MSDDRRAPVGDHDNLQAVFQGEHLGIKNPGKSTARQDCCQQKQGKHHDQQTRAATAAASTIHFSGHPISYGAIYGYAKGSLKAPYEIVM
jgi:hypothetical protein